MNSLEYWRKREAEQLRKRIVDEEERGKAIEKIYAEMRDAIQKQIDAFYGKYAKAEGITIAEAKKRASRIDIEAYARKAKKYVAEKDFTDQANAEMRLYNMTMKVNRLELLKAEIGAELCAGFSDLEKEFGEDLTSDAVNEMKRLSGILGGTVKDQVKRAKQLVNASFHNATFSDRIWMYQAMLKDELSTLLQEGLVQGKNSKDLARNLKKAFGVSANDAERLMRTEMTRVYTAAQHESLTEAGYDQYTFIAEPTACDVCKQLDGKHFPVEDLEDIGNHAPPIHPNCRCSVAAYMDREEFDRWLNEQEENKKQKNKTLIYDQNTTRLSQDRFLRKAHFKTGGLTEKDYIEQMRMRDIHSKVDITKRWTSKGGVGSISKAESVVIGGKKYIVDGKNVVLKPSAVEIEVANCLSQKYGYNVELLPRINNPKNVQLSDYLLNGERYDLKSITGSGKNTLYDAVAKKKKQSSNFIFNLTDCPLDDQEIERQITSIYSSNRTLFIDKIAVYSNGEIKKVYARKGK